MLKLKVYGGTATKNICLDCTQLREVQGIRESDCIRKCAAQDDMKIPFPVAKCSYYKEKDPDLSRYDNAMRLMYNKAKGKLMVYEYKGLFIDPWTTIEEYLAKQKAIEEALQAPLLTAGSEAVQ